MIKHSEGEVIYLSSEDFNDLDKKEQDFDYCQEIDRVIISNVDQNNCQKIKFDVIGNEEYWAAYVVGFLYSDGKFLGKFHSITDANLPVEPLSGFYEKSETDLRIRGILNQGTIDQVGFYFKIYSKMPSIGSKTISLSLDQTSRKVKRTVKKNFVNKTIAETAKVLNNDLLEKIISKSTKKEKIKARKGYDLYNDIVKWNCDPRNTNDLLIAMCIAYSWMPTMLEVMVKDKSELKTLLPVVKKLGKIKTLNQFLHNEEKIEAWILKLSVIVNNSIVGASKVLHIFYQDNIPIIDSNVLKGWNIIFKKYYKKYPELKMPKNIPATKGRQIKVFMQYWKLLLVWKLNTNRKSIRELEKPFYWIGMK
jgi:hypothetical protein